MTWQQAYLDRFYRSRSSWQDGTSRFHALLEGNIPPGSAICEIGPGPVGRTTALLGALGTVHGVDIDPEAKANPHLTRFSVTETEALPLPGASVDACVSDFVLEHIKAPAVHFAEVHRVLRAGGRYVFRTPNLFHYTSAVASVTPHWFHELVANRLRGLPEGAHEPYPTYHRANTRHQLLRLAADAGLQVQQLVMVEPEPSYGLAARPLFLTMLAYERTVNALGFLEALRANIFGVLVKPGTQS